jgi:hypothetical protein
VTIGYCPSRRPPPPPAAAFGALAGRYGERIRRLRAAAAGSPPAVISQQDARAWRFPAAGAGLLLDGVVTSPPYPAAYDYLAHARRVRSLWPADPAAGDAVVPPRGSRDWPEGRASRGSHLEPFRRPLFHSISDDPYKSIVGRAYK